MRRLSVGAKLEVRRVRATLFGWAAVGQDALGRKGQDAMTQPDRSVRPPRDPRNVWRILDALGVSREVASEGNARRKATGYDSQTAHTTPP